MENLPTNNPENINQEPATNEEQPLSFSEHMEQKQKYEQAFKEAQDNGSLPEGVRDAQDYREYLEEHQAREAEQSKAEQEAQSEFEKHSQVLIAEVANLEDVKDKCMLTAMLPILMRKSDSNRERTLKDQNVLLEFINRNDKKMSIRDFVTNKINSLKNNGASEEMIGRYYHINIDFMEHAERFAEIQSLNDSDSDLDDSIVMSAEEKGINVIGFNGYRKKINNIDIFSSENSHNHFDDRPMSDRGIILYMAKDLIAKTAEERFSKQQNLNVRKLAVLGKLYDGESFGMQALHAKTRFYEGIMGAIIHDDEKVNTDYSMGMLSIMQLSEDFRLLRHSYDRFERYSADGQAILDNFKNSQQ